MNCVLKTELLSELSIIQNSLEKLDLFFKEKHKLELKPSENFMSAWNKVKNARQLLASINLENEQTI